MHWSTAKKTSKSRATKKLEDLAKKVETMSDIIRDLKTKDLTSQQAYQPSGKRRHGGAKNN